MIFPSLRLFRPSKASNWMIKPSQTNAVFNFLLEKDTELRNLREKKDAELKVTEARLRAKIFVP
jgi:hypothetical protein